jgi:DNA topoisomerase-1
VPIGTDANGAEIIVRVWNNGASVMRGEEKAPVPFDLPPDELTVAKAEELLAKGAGGPRVLGDDPETGMPVLVLTGRFGPFVQLGEMDDTSKEKPKRASLLSNQEPDTVTLDEALALLSLPRVVGVDTDGIEITALNGRYGPYLKKDADSRSLESEEQLFTVTLAQAQTLFAQPKLRGRRTKPPIAELGAHPDSGAAVRVLDGRFGPYVTDGTINATVPRGIDPGEIDLSAAVELLREREARGPAVKKTPTKKATKKATKKSATKKTTKSVTKKSVRKKTAPTTTRVIKRGTSKTSLRGKAALAARSQGSGAEAPAAAGLEPVGPSSAELE